MKYERFYDDDETFRQKLLNKVRVIEQRVKHFNNLPIKKKLWVIISKLKEALKNPTINLAICSILFANVTIALNAINAQVNYDFRMSHSGAMIETFPLRYARAMNSYFIQLFNHPGDSEVIRLREIKILGQMLRTYKRIVLTLVQEMDRRMGRDSSEIKELLSPQSIDNIIRRDIDLGYGEPDRIPNAQNSAGYRLGMIIQYLTREYRSYFGSDAQRAEFMETERIAREAARMAEQRRREREAEFGH